VVLLPLIPNYQFVDSDNFDVFIRNYIDTNKGFEDDPCRDTIRGKYFGGKYKQSKQSIGDGYYSL